MDTVEAKDEQLQEMNFLSLRLPDFIKEQILQKMDNESFGICREVGRKWNEFVDGTKFSWVRIVKIPTILKRGETYLHLAAKHNLFHQFKEIIENEVDKDPVDNIGKSPFLTACLFGSTKIAKYLMEKSKEFQIDLSRKTDEQNSMTAFDLASLGNHSELAEMIMKNSVELKTHSDEENGKGFLLAVRFGKFKVVERLVKSMCLKLNISDKKGNTALHMACDLDHPEIAKILIKESTKLELDLNSRGTYGYTAFHMACERGVASVVKIMLEQADKFDIFLKAGVDDKNGFHLACHAGRTETVDIFIEKSKALNFDLAAKTKTGFTGFQLAEKNRRVDVVDLIKLKIPSLVVHTTD